MAASQVQQHLFERRTYTGLLESIYGSSVLVLGVQVLNVRGMARMVCGRGRSIIYSPEIYVLRVEPRAACGNNVHFDRQE